MTCHSVTRSWVTKFAANLVGKVLCPKSWRGVGARGDDKGLLESLSQLSLPSTWGGGAFEAPSSPPFNEFGMEKLQHFSLESCFEHADNSDDVLPAQWTVGDFLATVHAGDHVTTL